ncbi:hypothetical protein J6590_015136 [Homalodisca vitripennis]|nr:hypothetical protein J6590_015136 [Homalodisca vitripennis]
MVTGIELAPPIPRGCFIQRKDMIQIGLRDAYSVRRGPSSAVNTRRTAYVVAVRRRRLRYTVEAVICWECDIFTTNFTRWSIYSFAHPRFLKGVEAAQQFGGDLAAN